MNLRQLAKDKPCMIRLPGICSHNPEETRLCHLRMAGITGGAQKAPDAMGAWGCHPCSLATENGYEVSEAVRVMFLEGVMRTQYWLIRHGTLGW
jgi:hypothetical protein